MSSEANTQSVEVGITVKKDENFSEWYTQAVTKSELVDIRYNVQGLIVHRPLAALTLRNLYGLWEKELENTGHLPVIFPTLIPEENLLKEKEHVEGFAPEVFWVTHGGDTPLERKLALRPTGETAFYSMYSLWIKSYADLPLKLYQSCSSFRFEKTTRPFIRGREFLWIESHDVFRSEEGAEEQVKEDQGIAKKVLGGELSIPVMLFMRPAWDTFAGADHTFAFDVLMPDGKAIQVASTHLLGQHFAKAFNIKFQNEQGEEEFAHQTCFGPGIWRMMAAIVSVHGDDSGIILPWNVAPTQVVIVPITFSKKPAQETVAKCKALKEKLQASGLRVVFDDSDNTPGFKYNHWELRGVPVRLEIGPREVESGTVTVVERHNRKKLKCKDEELGQTIKTVSEMISTVLLSQAQEFLSSHITVAESLQDAVNTLNNRGGYVKVPFCSVEDAGRECAEHLKTESSGGKVRGIHQEIRDDPSGKKCIVCGKPAKHIVWVAKQY